MSEKPQHPPYSNPQTQKAVADLFETIAKIDEAIHETEQARHDRKLAEQEQHEKTDNP